MRRGRQRGLRTVQRIPHGGGEEARGEEGEQREEEDTEADGDAAEVPGPGHCGWR